MSLGDRKDGIWLKNEDPIHGIMPYIYPNRADNEAFIQESIEMAPIRAYVEMKNKGLEEGEEPYTPFHIILAALVKTMVLRPKLNRFIAGKKLYQKKTLSLGFVVKKKMTDDGGEALAFREFTPDATLETIHKSLSEEISSLRKEDEIDNSTDFMGKFIKIPPFILRPLFVIIRWLDHKGWMPYSLIKTDPNYASVFITNLGSIGLKAGYHHLSNWGTTSVFVILGERRWKPFYNHDGSYEMREVLDIGLTIDERIADGFYYSKSVRLLKKLLQNPELLEKRADEEID